MDNPNLPNQPVVNPPSAPRPSISKKVLIVGIIILLVLVATILTVLYKDRLQASKTPPTKTPSATDSATEAKWYDSYATSEKEKIVYEIISRRAKKSETVEIENCQPTPLWLEIEQGSKVRIINKDNVDIRLFFRHNKQTINISANSEISMQVDSAVGKYGYKCNDQEITAVFLVTPKLK